MKSKTAPNRRPASADSCVARPLRALLARSTLTLAAALTLTSIAHAADLVVDNSDPGFSIVGDWPASTAVAGYQGANYQTHIANGPVPGALTVDNQDAGFSVTGDWPVSTAVAGYLGANYRTHAANGPRPGSLVIDNTSGTALGTWPVSTAVAGYQGGNYQTHAAGNGTASFTWPLAGNGHYRVHARWTSHANRAGNARYTIRHTGGDTPVSVSQQQNGGSWQLLGTFELDANSQIVLTDDANGYVIADAVMAEPVAATPNTASWDLPVSLAGNYRLYARWSAHPNRATQARYTVSHTGGATPVSLNQQQNGGAWQLLGTYALAPGQARVALTDEADGYVVADAVMAVPDTAPAANHATWTPTLAQAGHYDVYARWTAHPNRATQARYTVRHVGGETAVVVNQQQGGGQWQLLGRFDLAPGQGAITLTDEADGYVIADAVRLTSVGPAQASLYFIHPDHLGTPRLVTDEQNTIVWRHLPTTEPFGNTPPEEDPNATGNRFEMNLAFPGQYRDRESGLSYNFFRDYDPAIGAYRQSDPIGLAGGGNTYGYVNGNPLSYADPSGLHPLVGLMLRLLSMGLTAVGAAEMPEAGLGGGPSIAAKAVRKAAAQCTGRGASAVTDEAFHYTFGRAVTSIESQGLRAGSYATPNGALSPLQAQIDLALAPNRGLPESLLRVDLAGMRQAGYQIPEVTQVGRSFGMPGGGFEMQFPYPIPPEFIKVIRP